MKTRILVASVALMAVALVLGGVFSLLTFDRFYRDALLGRYYLAAKHLHANLQRAVSGGVDLTRARAVNRDVQRTHRVLTANLDGLESPGRFRGADLPIVLVASSRGEVLYQAGGSDLGVGLPPAFADALSTPNGPGETASARRYVKVGEYYAVPVKLFDRDGRWVGSVMVTTGARSVDEKSIRLLVRSAVIVSIAIFVFLAAYAVLLAVVYTRDADRGIFPKSHLLWLSGCFGAIAQVAVATLGAVHYLKPYEETTVEGTDLVLSFAKLDTESALRKGLRLDDLDFRHYPWQSLLGEYGELGSIDVLSTSGRLVSRVRTRNLWHASEVASFASVPPLETDDFTQYRFRYAHLMVDNRAVGHVVAKISLQALHARVLDLVADGLAATMISLLLFMEVLLLCYIRLDDGAKQREARDTRGLSVIRPAAFLFLFGLDMSMSFVPLHMEKLYRPILGLSKDFVIGLPISMEFLCVGIAILVAGLWIDRGGWRRPFLLGVLLAGIGALYSWLAADALHFIISRGVLGIGFGLVLMSSQGFVIATTDARGKAAGLAQLFAGIYGGSIAGSVAGAILAERLGFSAVFLIGAVIVFMVLLFSLGALPRQATRPTGAPSSAELAPGEARERFWRFFTNRSMLGLMLFSSLPASIAAVGFLNYFSPIYLNRAGASQSTIGQVLMLYGICLVVLGPWVSGGVDTAERKRLAVVAGCILGATALFSFNALSGVTAAVVAVLLLGISHSLVLSSQSAYALALKTTREFGEGKAISIFRSSSRLGQMLGPIAFGWVMVATDIERGITYLGCAYLLLAVSFWLITGKDRALLVEGEA